MATILDKGQQPWSAKSKKRAKHPISEIKVLCAEGGVRPTTALDKIQKKGRNGGVIRRNNGVVGRTIRRGCRSWFGSFR